MKRLLITLAFITSYSAAQTPAAPPSKARTGVARSVKEIDARTPKLPPFKPQQPTRIQLENGMVIFLQEDHELPFINGTARIRGGSRDVPPEKVGLTGIYGEAWRTGGTKSQTGDQMDDFLETRAASVETGAQLQSTTISFSALKDDFNDVFKLFVELMQNPEFRQDKVDLAKNQAKTAISRRNEDPSGIAAREAAKVVYGPNSPYGRHSEYWTVDAVTRQDLLDFHKKYLHPNNMILGIVGDFDSKQMEARLRQVFGAWSKGPGAQVAKEGFKAPAPGVHVIEKEDVNQSSIRLVTLGTRRDNPDFYAITVMNEALGGGFAARLFSNIRSKQGLAYSVGGGIGVAFDYPGIFQFVMGTKSEQTAKAVRALYREIENLKKQPFTAEEIAKAKDNILNSWIFNFDSKEEVLAEKMLYEFYGYPLDTLEKFRQGVEKVTVADVNQMVDKYVENQKFAIVVVGKPADFDEPLSAFGTVRNVDITIPAEPPSAVAKPGAHAAPKESNAAGKALIEKVIAAMGGKEKLAGLQSVTYKAQSVRVTPQGEMTLDINDVRVLPDKARTEISAPMGQMTLVVSPDAAFMAQGDQKQDMPASMRTEGLKDLRRDLLSLAKTAAAANYSFTASDSGSKVSVLDIGTDMGPVRWEVDPSTGLVQKATYKSVSAQGPVEREVTYSNYKNVDGVLLPFAREVKENGQLVSKTTVSEARINAAVDPAAFAK
jgi:zinc protease